MKSLPSHKLVDILKGLHEGGTYRAIGNKYSVSKNSVHRIDMRLSAVGITAQQALALTPEAIHELFHPGKQSNLIEPDWDFVHQKLRQKNVTPSLLYQDYLSKHEGAGKVYVYQSFCRPYAQWKKDNGISEHSGNIDRHPGERMEIDFAGDQLLWADSFGEIHKAKLFVATLPYSCMVFAEAFENEKQSSIP